MGFDNRDGKIRLLKRRERVRIPSHDERANNCRDRDGKKRLLKREDHFSLIDQM